MGPRDRVSKLHYDTKFVTKKQKKKDWQASRALIDKKVIELSGKQKILSRSLFQSSRF